MYRMVSRSTSWSGTLPGRCTLGHLPGSPRTLASNRLLAAEYFLGVAGHHSDSGVTGDLLVWNSGLFKYPLKNARFAKPGYKMIPAGSGVTLYSQKLAIESGTTTYYIGQCAEYGQFKSSVECILRSRRVAPLLNTH